MTYYIRRKTPASDSVIHNNIADLELALFMLADIAKNYGISLEEGQTSFWCKEGGDDYHYSIFED